MNGDIIIRGASEHNLKHINVKIPRNSLTVPRGRIPAPPWQP